MNSFKRCWEVIKGDIMPLFEDLFDGELQLFQLNFRMVSLWPKKEDVLRIVQSRPICLLNVSFNFFYQGGYK